MVADLIAAATAKETESAVHRLRMTEDAHRVVGGVASYVRAGVMRSFPALDAWKMWWRSVQWQRHGIIMPERRARLWDQ